MTPWLWFCTDWHWAMCIGAFIGVVLFGFIIVIHDDSGDWFIF